MDSLINDHWRTEAPTINLLTLFPFKVIKMEVRTFRQNTMEEYNGNVSEKSTIYAIQIYDNKGVLA